MIKWLVRIGCAVGILVIVGVLGLLLAGGGRPIAHSQASATFSYPAARIWPWIVEAPRLKQWLGGFVDSIPADGGGLRVGARSKELIDLDGRRWELQSEVTALEPPRRIKLHLVADDFEDDSEYTLEEHDGTTVLTYRSDAHYTMLLARLMSPLIRRDVEHKVQADLAELRELLAHQPVPAIAPPIPGNTSAIPGCCAPDPTDPAPPGAH